MHGVNLDLLQAMSAHQPDGRPKDPHAHHAAEHKALRRTERHRLWRARLARLRKVLRFRAATLRAEGQS